MKSLIVAFIFAIGMFLTLPSTASRSGSGSPPDQVSFVVEQTDIAPAIAFVQVATIEEVVVFELAGIKPPGYLPAEVIVQKAPDSSRWYNLNYRTCLITNKVRNQNKFFAKNKVSITQIRIRDDTSV